MNSVSIWTWLSFVNIVFTFTFTVLCALFSVFVSTIRCFFKGFCVIFTGTCWTSWRSRHSGPEGAKSKFIIVTFYWISLSVEMSVLILTLWLHCWWATSEHLYIYNVLTYSILYMVLPDLTFLFLFVLRESLEHVGLPGSLWVQILTCITSHLHFCFNNTQIRLISSADSVQNCCEIFAA